MKTNTLNRTLAITFTLAALLGPLAYATGGTRDHVVVEASSTTTAGARCEIKRGSQRVGGGLSPQKESIWKYTARCALRRDQELVGPAGPDGQPLRFKGDFGLAPEWESGTCDAACQERVSSCLLALTNRTGKHVKVSLLSAAPSMSQHMRANDDDAAFPHQEGVFFGNVFTGEGFACSGRGVAKAPQVKRFCALDPQSCSGLARFVDAGRCEDACEMSCSTLSDGSQRCLAVRCQDPTGRLWNEPITTYMRDRIEAGNADEIVGAVSRDQELDGLRDGSAATFRAVDFGGGRTHGFTANLQTSSAGGRIEIWLDGTRRLGALPLESTGGKARDLAARIDARAVSGLHDVVLRFTGLRAQARLATISFQ